MPTKQDKLSLNHLMFDPVLDNLPQPVDGIDPQLELLTQREQLMEDIDGIVEEFACNNNISEDDMEDLIKTLCDSVCKNFPS